MKPPRILAFAAALAAAAPPSPASPELAPPFRDHAVLQSGKPVAVWGAAGAGERVRVDFAGQAVASTAGADGRWVAVLAPLVPNSAGADLTVTGRGAVSIHDVVVGEVWICAGAPDREPSPAVPVRRRDDAAAVPPARASLIRRFVVEPRASQGAPASWESAPDPPDTGAAGLFFARDLSERLGEAFGVITCLSPDAPIESWMSPAALARFQVAAPAASGDPGAPASLFNRLIVPLGAYGIRGAVWQQGGADLSRAAEYALRFPAMIGAWRGRLGGGDLPFYWVQLPARRPVRGSPAGRCAAFREAQSRALSLPATGEAVAIDLGGSSPGDAREIGRRLSLLAKAGAYSIPDDDSGPVFGTAQVAGTSIIVRFSRGADGLTASGRPLQSFEAAGADRVFHPASAEISGSTVVVRSAAVRQPVAVRYAWSDAPDANLFNGAGLPAAPFRSDDW